MRYCTRCITPSTRPNISFDAAGLCNACAAHATKPRIDWGKRKEAFLEVVRRAKGRSAEYDCVIPVSGGKDSTWQAVRCLEYGLHPLAVTWKTPGRTALGQRNLDNLVGLGVDHIDFQINPGVERRFMRSALERHGSTAIPMHLALFNIPLSIAARFGIPLVVWGENSAFEYGGPEDERQGFRMDRAWLKRYGVTQGTTAQDWIGQNELTAQELTPYRGPGDDELERLGVLAVFLGYYFPWDPQESFRVASAHGFQARAEGPKTGYYNYADIDDDFISIHHFLKWYKFGFTRTFDNLSLEIRNGRISREEAIAAVRAAGDETPWEDIASFCAFTGMSREEFFQIIERFRNPQVWERAQGAWRIKDFLIPDWRWHENFTHESAAHL
jgi:N-acetyl sugar amidotransferase